MEVEQVVSATAMLTSLLSVLQFDIPYQCA